jgi:phosphoglycerate kinase
MSKFSEHNFKGEKALVRVDFNVPLDQYYRITDDTRISATIPTLKKILDDGGSVILMSHFGRPKNGYEEKYSMKHQLVKVEELLGRKIQFANDSIGDDAIKKAKDLKPGEVLLLENLRFHIEEEKGDEGFAEKLSKLGDVYVNDAFGTAHRAHASTAVIAKFFPPEKKMFGLLMEKEVESAGKVLHSSEKPFLAIIGGAKVSDKILIIENLLDKATDIIIGGAMAYTFYKAEGGKIGNSLCEMDKLDTALDLLKKAAEKNVCIHLPQDSIIADRFDNNAEISGALSNNIPDGWMGLDIGQMAIESFCKVISNSKTILWNGPMGVFEMEKFQHGTKAIAQAVADATAKGAFSLIGGGDSGAAVNKFNLEDKISFVSTGGGAILEYFEGKTLPGIKAIQS